MYICNVCRVRKWKQKKSINNENNCRGNVDLLYVVYLRKLTNKKKTSKYATSNYIVCKRAKNCCIARKNCKKKQMRTKEGERARTSARRTSFNSSKTNVVVLDGRKNHRKISNWLLLLSFFFVLKLDHVSAMDAMARGEWLYYLSLCINEKSTR